MARQRTNEPGSTKHMRIGGRLLLLLAVPLAGLLAATGYGVVSGVQQAREASGLQERTQLALTAYALIDELQVERTTLVDGGETAPETRAAVQTHIESLRAQSAEIGGQLQLETDRALVRVDGAQRVDAIGLGGRAALGSHSGAIARLLDLAAMAIDPGGTLDAAPAETANNLARAQEASAQERDLVVVVSDEGDLSARSFQELTSLASAQRSYADLAASSAPSALAIQIERVGHGIDAADAVRRDVFSDPGQRDYTNWISGLEGRTAELERLQNEGSALAVSAVDDLATSSRVLLVLAALAAIATVLITLLLLRRASRSISRPLEELAAQAEEVARTRLPAAVRSQQLDPSEGLHLPALRATGAAEVYEVAAAFNDVQDTALRLAGEQAALRVNQSEALTNLGRRNQTLLARQLDFITSLETEETDPAFLEHLFKLDHLASRMRRNAESLLILAGSETPRRRRAPAQVSEVIRAAMSEVEEFERVRIGHLRDATLTGPVVIDLIHLLAEIIENALGFSPPDSTVEIDGRSLGQGGYQFAVIDHGVGMSDVELVAANQRLAGLDELEGMPTRYLGQYVVAKLAAKTGVMVRLQPSSGGRGVTALVILPSASVVGAPDRSNVASPLPGSRASREQGPEPFAPGAGVASSIDPPAVIEASVVPDLRDPAPFELRPFESVEFDPGPYEPSTHDSSSVGSQSEVAGSEVAGFGPAAFEADESGISFDEEVYDRTTFDHLDLAPVDPTPVEPAPVGSDGPDPWAQFSRNMFDDVDTAAGEVTPEQAFAAGPPPVPEAVPDQPDWSPELDTPFSAAAPADREDVVASQAPDSTPTPDAVPAAASSAMGGQRPAGAGGTGGLARRVPGASLAESRQPGPADAPAAPVDRSADGVRSMLSSFQAGRSRGRVAPDAESPQTPSAAPAAPPPAPTFGELDDHDISQDGRSSR